jgi:AraC-like DNA-binding protein/ligand-binding sensor protein
VKGKRPAFKTNQREAFYVNQSEFELLRQSPELREIFALAWRLFEVNLTLVSTDGEVSACYDKSTQQSPFCLALQSLQPGQHLCDDCDRRFYRQVAEQLVPLRYRCHAGLTEFLVPVVRYGRLIALLQCGQVLDAKPSLTEWHRTRETKLREGLNTDSLETLFLRNRVLPPTKQTDLVRFMELVANHLAYSPCFATAANHKQEALRRIISYVETNMEEPLLLEAIASASGVSVRSLSRLFRQETGMTVLDFVQERRIARACHYLTTSDRTCIEVAFAVGFQSIQNFNRTFRKLKHTTPREWRLRLAKQNQNTAVKNGAAAVTDARLSHDATFRPS